MSEKDIIIFPNRRAVGAANQPSLTRARSFKIRTDSPNFKQYIATVNAYASAGMPFEHIANAGDLLEDEVERQEVDALVREGWQNKAGEIVEDAGQIMAWQTRGEKVSTIPQLSAPQSVTGQEMITVSQSLTTVDEPTQEKIVDVIEGIKVSLTQNTPSALLNTTSHDQELENNPYLKKAA